MPRQVDPDSFALFSPVSQIFGSRHSSSTCVLGYNGVFITTLWPLAVAFILLVVLPPIEMLLRGKSYTKIIKNYVTPLLYLTFLIYISTSKILFSFFKCQHLVDTDQYWLEDDYSFQCYTPEYNEVKWFIWLMILVYPIGVSCRDHE